MEQRKVFSIDSALIVLAGLGFVIRRRLGK